MASFSIPELFETEINEGVDIFAGGRMDVDYNEPSEREKEIVRKIFKARVKQIGRVSQKVADTLTPQMEVFVKFAGVAKAMFPENKQIRYPSEAGSIGCDFINIPQFVRYNTTIKTDYLKNSWMLAKGGALVGGNGDDKNDPVAYAAKDTAYILGDATNWYKSSSASEERSLTVFAQDGFLEIGTGSNTPILNQFQITTEIQSKYAPYNITPLNELLSIEDHKNLFQMSTMGVLPVYHNLGTKLTAQVDAAGNPTLIPIGMVFYEHNFYNAQKSIA